MLLARSLGPSLRQVDHGQSSGGLRGAGSSGWARGLVELGAGLYEERALDGYDEAVRAAALALRRTDRPVGLIVWRGAHAWVMTGFTATTDPLVDPSFEVTGVYVQDPWYPRVSSIWGPGQDPSTYLSTKALAEDSCRAAGGNGMLTWQACSSLSCRSIRSRARILNFDGCFSAVQAVAHRTRPTIQRLRRASGLGSRSELPVVRSVRGILVRTSGQRRRGPASDGRSCRLADPGAGMPCRFRPARGVRRSRLGHVAGAPPLLQ